MNNAFVLLDYDNGRISRFVGRQCTDILSADISRYPIPAADVEMFRVLPLDFKEMIGAEQ
jgi:hypothetical protein